MQQHVHAADAQHGVVEVEGVEEALVKVRLELRVAEDFRVLPPEQMAKMKADIDAMSNTDPNKVVLKRFIGSGSVQVTLDKAGRICLPDDMARKADVMKEAVLVGLLDRFEIWNPARYEQVKAADEALAARAFELME